MAPATCLYIIYGHFDYSDGYQYQNIQVVGGYQKAKYSRCDDRTVYQNLQFEPWKYENCLGLKTFIAKLLPDVSRLIVLEFGTLESMVQKIRIKRQMWTFISSHSEVVVFLLYVSHWSFEWPVSHQWSSYSTWCRLEVLTLLYAALDLVLKGREKQLLWVMIRVKETMSISSVFKYVK